jgi:hypothetical protein
MVKKDMVLLQVFFYGFDTKLERLLAASAAKQGIKQARHKNFVDLAQSSGMLMAPLPAMPAPIQAAAPIPVPPPGMMFPPMPPGFPMFPPGFQPPPPPGGFKGQ